MLRWIILYYEMSWYTMIWIRSWHVMACYDMYWNEEFYHAEPLKLWFQSYVMNEMIYESILLSEICEKWMGLSSMTYLPWKIWKPHALLSRSSGYFPLMMSTNSYPVRLKWSSWLAWCTTITVPPSLRLQPRGASPTNRLRGCASLTWWAYTCTCGPCVEKNMILNDRFHSYCMCLHLLTSIVGSPTDYFLEYFSLVIFL